MRVILKLEIVLQVRWIGIGKIFVVVLFYYLVLFLPSFLKSRPETLTEQTK